MCFRHFVCIQNNYGHDWKNTNVIEMNINKQVFKENTGWVLIYMGNKPVTNTEITENILYSGLPVLLRYS